MHAMYHNILNMAMSNTRYSFYKDRWAVIMIPVILLYFLRLCASHMSEMKYLINMDSQMECCDEKSKGFADTSSMIVGSYNETVTYMHGDIKFLKDVGPYTTVEIILQKEASGSYQPVYTHEICNLCEEVAKGEDSDYHPYIKYFGIPDKCPFAAGDYPIKEFVLDSEDLPLNSNTAGRYKAFLYLYNNPAGDCKTNKELMCCLTCKVIIEMDG